MVHAKRSDAYLSIYVYVILYYVLYVYIYIYVCVYVFYVCVTRIFFSQHLVGKGQQRHNQRLEAEPNQESSTNLAITLERSVKRVPVPPRFDKQVVDSSICSKRPVTLKRHRAAATENLISQFSSYIVLLSHSVENGKQGEDSEAQVQLQSYGRSSVLISTCGLPAGAGCGEVRWLVHLSTLGRHGLNSRKRFSSATLHEGSATGGCCHALQGGRHRAQTRIQLLRLFGRWGLTAQHSCQQSHARGEGLDDQRIVGARVAHAVQRRHLAELEGRTPPNVSHAELA